MPSDSKPTAPGYLYHVLVDGVKPFRYRSGVRSLLGISEQAGGGALPIVHPPPVAFPYVSEPAADDRETLAMPLALADGVDDPHPPAPSPAAVGEGEQGAREPARPAVQVAANQQATITVVELPARPSGAPPLQPFGPAAPAEIPLTASMPAAPQHAVADDAPLRPEGQSSVPGEGEPARSVVAVAASQQATITIPEPPARRSVAAALQSFKSPTRPPDPPATIPLTDPASDGPPRPSGGMPPSGPRPALASGSMTPQTEVSSQPPAPETLAARPAAQPPRRERIPMFVRPQGQRPSAPEHELEEVQFHTKDHGSAVERRPVADQTPLASAARQVVAPARAGQVERGAFEPVDQLEHALRKLAAKESAPHANDQVEWQPPEPQPPPPQPVVIVKYAAPPDRTPHAFWERRRLGRMYLRRLR